MAKPALSKTNPVIMAALMGQGLHVVTRPAFTLHGVRYVPLIHYHATKGAAMEDYRFAGDGGTYYEYSAAEVLAATV